MEFFRVFNLFIYDDPKLIGEKNKKKTVWGIIWEKTFHHKICNSDSFICAIIDN